MADNNLERAQQVYQTLCNTLDNRNWKYGKNEEKLAVFFGVNGDDIPLQIVIMVDERKQLVSLMSKLPFQMSEEKRMEGAIATCVVNYQMADGGFDYDVTNGTIVFRMTATFRGSTLGEGLFQYMIDCTCVMVDKYNDLFLALDKGIISIADFIEKIS